MSLQTYKRLPFGRRLGWADVAVAVLVFATGYGIVRFGADMAVPFEPDLAMPAIDLNVRFLPFYAGRSLVRMFAAFGASIVFTFVYGYVAAKNESARKVMIPLLDILQSVPILGFLSATVTAFIALFPGSLLGVELASIFAIFTSQVWNMTFSFYHSLITVPHDLQEAATVFRLNRWQRLIRLEVPHSMIGLVWNSMMSFGGGWFFLAASEAITVLNMDVRLPGLGSYLATALEQQNMQAVLYTIGTMIVVIVAVDQLFWRPVVAWSQRFKVETSEGTYEPTSAFLTVLRRSSFAQWLGRNSIGAVGIAIDKAMFRLADASQSRAQHGTSAARLWRPFVWMLLAGLVALVGRYVLLGGRYVVSLGSTAIGHVVGLGGVSLVRVIVTVVLGALWTVPVGVTIGLNPRLARSAQPIVQVAASFPANLLFPFATMLYLAWNVNFEIGTIPLMMLGTQWYILFNVIAGASAIPNDLLEAAAVFKVRGRQRWQRLILPAVFPFLITGMVTAAGGAWNATIVAEIVTWGDKTLVATGLGADIAHATAVGDWPRIIWGITVMAAYVVGMNQILWQPLYRLAERRFTLE